MKAAGAFSVKSYNQPRREQRQQIIAAARELEMMVVPEGGSLFHHDMTMVADGHTGIEHTVPTARNYSDVMQLWGKTQVGYTPTLVVAYGGWWGEAAPDEVSANHSDSGQAAARPVLAQVLGVTKAVLQRLLAIHSAIL